MPAGRGREILACFEPRSNTAVTNVFEDRFADALALADIESSWSGSSGGKKRIPEDQKDQSCKYDPNRIEEARKKRINGCEFSTNSDLEKDMNF